MQKRLVFICVENSNRSQMAQAFANMLGGNQILAYSAGSKPSGKINPKAVRAMKELDYDLSQHESASIEALPDVEFDFAATMGCGDSYTLVRAKKTESWDIPDPKNLADDQFRQIRDIIKDKVAQALNDLPSSNET